jgi:hypothetical protein
MKITRRKLATTLVSSAVAAAQTIQPVPSTPEEELKAARASNRRNAEVLQKFKVPMATEPAFQFKA